MIQTVVMGLAFAAIGVALGGGYFLLLNRAVRLQIDGGSALNIAALYVGRLGAAIVVFWLVAQHGALPLVATLGGFLVARLVAQRIVRVG